MNTEQHKLWLSIDCSVRCFFLFAWYAFGWDFFPNHFDVCVCIKYDWKAMALISTFDLRLTVTLYWCDWLTSKSRRYTTMIMLFLSFELIAFSTVNIRLYAAYQTHYICDVPSATQAIVSCRLCIEEIDKCSVEYFGK